MPLEILSGQRVNRHYAVLHLELHSKCLQQSAKLKLDNEVQNQQRKKSNIGSV